MKVRIVSAVVATVLSTVCLQAHASLVTNGSFEAGTFVDNGDSAMSVPTNNTTTITGWKVVNDNVTWIKEPAFGNLNAPDLLFFLDLTDYQSGTPFGGVQQDIATTAGTTYRVSFQLGSDSRYGLPSALTVSADASTQDFSTSAAGPDAWTTFSWDFVASDSSTTLSFLGKTGQNYIGLDNVSVNAVNAVPTPGTLALVGLGLVGLGFSRRKTAA